MKKVISLLLSITMLFSITAGIDMSAYAIQFPQDVNLTENSYPTLKITTSKTNVNPGDIVDVTATLSSASQKIRGFDYRFSFSKGLTFVSGSGSVPSQTVKNLNIIMGKDFMENNGQYGVVAVLYDSVSIKSDTVIAKFKCKVDSSAHDDLKIGVSYVELTNDDCDAITGVVEHATLKAPTGIIRETEDNQYKNLANPLTLGTTMMGSLSYDSDSAFESSDTDFFKYTAPCDMKIKVQFSHEYINSTKYEYYGDGGWAFSVKKYNSSSSNTNYDMYEDTLFDDYIDWSDGTVKTPVISLKSGETIMILVEYPWNWFFDAVTGYDYGVTVQPYVSSTSNLKVSTRNTTSLKLAWNKVSSVSGYQLQRKSGSSYKTVANTSSTSYTISNLKSATAYTFRVRAYKTINGTKYYSGWTTLTTPTKPGTPSIKAPATNKKHQIIAKWNTVARASGYQVQYSKKKNFNSVIATKTVSGQSKTSCTGNNFTKGKTYYVRVRAYKTVNGTKYYGAWSKVKSIKCK